MADVRENRLINTVISRPKKSTPNQTPHRFIADGDFIWRWGKQICSHYGDGGLVAFALGTDWVVRETPLDYGDLPESCPYTWEQAIDPEFLPE